jgi:hypothetical protein
MPSLINVCPSFLQNFVLYAIVFTNIRSAKLFLAHFPPCFTIIVDSYPALIFFAIATCSSYQRLPGRQSTSSTAGLSIAAVVSSYHCIINNAFEFARNIIAHFLFLLFLYRTYAQVPLIKIWSTTLIVRNTRLDVSIILRLFYKNIFTAFYNLSKLCVFVLLICFLNFVTQLSEHI